MPPARARIHAYAARLDSLFAKATQITDLEIKAHWTKYLCVLASGYIETAVRSVAAEYAEGKAHPNISNFVESHIRDFQNPSANKIVEFVRSFNPAWADDFAAKIEGETKDSVDSIVSNRCQIAHGEWIGLSYAVMARYYEGAKRLVEALLARFGL